MQQDFSHHDQIKRQFQRDDLDAALATNFKKQKMQSNFNLAPELSEDRMKHA